MSKAVFIDDRPGGNFLRHGSRVVFPAREAALRRRIEALAREAGVPVARVRGEPVDFKPKRGDTRGKVVCIGEDLAPIARLYAYLTGRPEVASLTVRASDASILNHLKGAEILVALSSQLTPKLLDLLFEAGLEHRCGHTEGGMQATGLICASTLDSLRKRAVFTAAAIRIAPPRKTSHLELALGGAMLWRASEGPRLDPKPDPESLRRALRRGDSLLQLNSHCDGIDALLSRDLTLCPRQLPTPPADPATGPYCAATGFCHRQNMPVKEAEREGRLLGPDALLGRLLLFATCQGALPVNPVIGREWTLIDGFLDTLGVVAIVTTWEVCVPPGEELSVAAGRLLRGMPAGEAVARFNHGEVARRYGCRLVLFGDPRLTLARRGGAAPPSKPAGAARENPPPGRLADVMFLRAYLTLSLVDLPERSASSMQAAQQAVAKYEYHIWRGAPAEGPRRPGGELRAAVLGFVASRGGSPFHAWMGMASDISDEPGPNCGHCGLPTRFTCARLRLAGDCRRLMVRCPACGIIAEGPPGLDLRLVMDGDRLSLSGALPVENWAGILHVACQREEESVAFPWPVDPGGRPGPLSLPRESLPPGPLRIAAVLMREAELIVVSLPFRKVPTSS